MHRSTYKMELPILQSLMKPLHCVLLGLVASAPWAPEPAWSDPISISSIVEDIGKHSDTPLIDVAIATADNICYAERHGDAPGGAAGDVAKDSPPRFHAASISKLLTATVVMQLQQEGKLSILDRVGRYEPAFKDSPIKVINLLTHTSGLRDLEHANHRRDPEQADAYIASLARQELSHLPGELWRYSDGGYNLLGRIVERVTALSFPEAMRERLLEPLSMRNSDFDIERIPVESRVTAIGNRGQSLAHPWDVAFLPSSGLQTTAEDLAKFAQAILAIHSDGEGVKPIDPTSLKDMTHARTATEWKRIDQGLGWQLAETEIGPQWRHAGSERGFEGLLTLYPEAGFAIVVLGNRADWPRFDLERKLRSIQSRDPTHCFN